MSERWTQEQRVAASKALYLRKFGEDDAREEDHQHWARRGGDEGTTIDLQCELTAAKKEIGEARELLDLKYPIESVEAFREYGRQWSERKEAWLTRNATPEPKKEG